ncbi:hypothetical protein R2325_16585 [Mycobacteroides chelonae]|uniref:hypothetical protein n=1 Tax=Mycobacteroides chelonae TaxID=1774 RepID=UPI002DED4834|nr:hypothetical protein [Mycobacteroides chelonae]MEC4873602.1 hypothetical protein [Mycobacteroides chelonae]
MITELKIKPDTDYVEQFGGAVARRVTRWYITWTECDGSNVDQLTREVLSYSDIPGVLQEIYRDE